MTEQAIEGTLKHDWLGYESYVRVGSKVVKHWIWERLAEIPEGSYVRISVEILDVPHD